jgi:hypothetical protein
MKLRDLRHGRGDVASSWPPGFGGAYAAGDKFPIGEVGKLTNVEPSERVPGVTVDIEYRNRSWSGIMQWNGERPTVERVVEVLSRHVGKDVRGLGNLELD